MTDPNPTDHAPHFGRTARTWEVELLISGVAVFAMLQLPGLLDDAVFALEPRAGERWRMLLVLAYIYAKSATVVLAATFAIHLLLRAQWIALVGVHSVYPDGVRLERLKLGPIQLALESARKVPMTDEIERADNRASVVFAIGVMIATLFVAICLVFCGSLLLLTLLTSALGLDFEPMLLLLALAALAFLPYLAAVLVDRARGAQLPVGGRSRALVERAFEMSRRLGLSANNNAIMAVLMTSDQRRRMMLAIHGTMLLSLCAVGAAFVMMTRAHLFGSYGGFPREATSRIEAAYYDDQRDPSRDRPRPFVPGLVAEGPYLQLTIPYEPRRDAAAMQRCTTPAKATDAQRGAALLACLQDRRMVSLDGRRLEGLRFEAASDPRTRRPALLAMIDLRALAPGRHELQVSRPPYSDRTPDPDEPTYDRIPFWR